MTIYDELIKRVSEGEKFNINFETRTMKVGNTKLIDNGKYDENRLLIYEYNIYSLQVLLHMIRELYRNYKTSIPSERSSKKRKCYFKALPAEELTDEQLMCGERREVAQAILEGFVLCMILNGELVWDEDIMGKWFWQSRSDGDLVILRTWVDGNKK
jgi:hypothetical protein